MRDVNGWVIGAVGAAALVGAFFLGGRVTAGPARQPRRRRRDHGRGDGPGRHRVRLRARPAGADA